MKILNLKFKNINSLAGEHSINFTEEKFTENGIFAITGKTGAGKSSILDAISLALYGETPRVEVTGTNNDVMTRGEKDCFAEVIFEAGKKKWTAIWKQERTKTGNLKQVERMILDENNQIIAEKREADEKIKKIIGLNFEQFTKVILLAQGSFTAFLQAKPQEKGALLEQITGTEIYRKISKNIFERNKIEKHKLEIINRELSAIELLTDEDIQKLNEESSDFEEQIKILGKDLQILEREKIATETIKKLETLLDNSKRNLKTKKESFSVAEMQLNNQFKDVLDGKEISHFYKEREDIKVHGIEIKNIIDLLNKILENKKQIAENNFAEKIEDKKKIAELLQENIRYASLEAQRELLEAGKPCPLCGATEHPFANKKFSHKESELKTINAEILKYEKLLVQLEAEIEENRKKIKMFKTPIAEDKACLQNLEQARKTELEKYVQIDKTIKDAEALEKKKNELNLLKEEILKEETSIQVNTKHLAEENSKITLQKSLPELKNEYLEKKLKSDSLSQKMGANKQKIYANNKNFEKSKQKLAEQDTQKIISAKWEKLNSLIGQADGTKFNNFAQALTFENLIKLANRQLKKMSERYMLKRIGDLNNPFELSVIDTYQNCEERTAQNLSGGEKFIVSLALALGLAGMASKNIRIDTMFIDEGFGTLDNEYLEQALNALSALRNEGKLIGVISHLSELKERISTHIEVVTVGGGRSIIV